MAGPPVLPPTALPVPLYQQKQNFSCGAAATLALLRYWKHDEFAHTGESALYGPLQTNREGTDPQPMARFISQQPGLHAEFRCNEGKTRVGLDDLKTAVDRGEPVIVSIQAWRDEKRTRDWTTDWDDGHYLVMTGHDKDNLYFMDPDTRGHYAYIPQREFMERWHDIMGKDNVHTDHIAIFVHGTTHPYRPSGQLSDRVSRIK